MLHRWDPKLDKLGEGRSDGRKVFANLGRKFMYVARDIRRTKLALKFAQTKRPVFEVVLKSHDRRVDSLVAKLGELIQTVDNYVRSEWLHIPSPKAQPTVKKVSRQSLDVGGERLRIGDVVAVSDFARE